MSRDIATEEPVTPSSVALKVDPIASVIERVLKVVMNLVMLAAGLTLLATVWALWEALHDSRLWGTVGELTAITATLFVFATLIHQVGKGLCGGRSNWWGDDTYPKPQTQPSAQPQGQQRPADFGVFATDALNQMPSSPNATGFGVVWPICACHRWDASRLLGH